MLTIILLIIASVLIIVNIIVWLIYLETIHTIKIHLYNFWFNHFVKEVTEEEYKKMIKEYKKSA